MGCHATAKPTLWLIGDSTVRVGTRGQQGWGTALPKFFETRKIEIKNHAKGGRSSRTFLTEGLWEEVSNELKHGDYVLIQFGHNDTSPIEEELPITDATRCRGTIKGNADESLEVSNILNDNREIVYSFGFYLRGYAKSVIAHGATPIIVSPIPKRGFINGGARRGFDGYRDWAKEAAEQSGAYFLDLNTRVADKFDEIGEEASVALFNDSVHTNSEGAAFNAKCVAEGILELSGCDLKRYLKPISRF